MSNPPDSDFLGPSVISEEDKRKVLRDMALGGEPKKYAKGTLEDCLEGMALASKTYHDEASDLAKAGKSIEYTAKMREVKSVDEKIIKLAKILADYF